MKNNKSAIAEWVSRCLKELRSVWTLILQSPATNASCCIGLPGPLLSQPERKGCC